MGRGRGRLGFLGRTVLVTAVVAPLTVLGVWAAGPDPSPRPSGADDAARIAAIIGTLGRDVRTPTVYASLLTDARGGAP